MKTIQNFVRLSAQVPLIVASIFLFLLMVMTFADVIMRSTFNAPFEAATELTRMFMAIVVFLALPVISARGEHIVVDLADPLFKNEWSVRLRDGIINLACGLMLFWPAERVVVLAERARSYGDVTEYLAIPLFYIEYFIAIMTFITAVILVIRGLITLIAPKLLETEE